MLAVFFMPSTIPFSRTKIGGEGPSLGSQESSTALGAALLVTEKVGEAGHGVEKESAQTQERVQRYKQKIIFLGRTMCDRHSNDLEFSLSFICKWLKQLWNCNGECSLMM